MVTPSLTHTVPAAIQARLGDVLASFALMEQSLLHLVASLISTDNHIGAAVCVQVPTKNLETMGLSLYHVHFGEDDAYRELVALMKRFHQCTEERNQIVHSFWDGFGPPLFGDETTTDSVVRIKIRATDSLEWKRTTITVESLDQMARRMDDVARDVIEFWRLNEGRARRRFAQHVAETIPADEIKPRPRNERR